MFEKALRWIRDQVLKPIWDWIKEVNLWEWGLVAGTVVWSTVMPDGLAIGLMATMAPKVSDTRKYHKQWNVFLGLGWLAVSLGLWFWVREVAVILLSVAVVRIWKILVEYYQENRMRWWPGAAVLLTAWDLFGEFGDDVLGRFRTRLNTWAETNRPKEPYLSKRVAKSVRWWPSSSKEARVYDLKPFEGRKTTRYWVEEHRNPTKKFAGEQSVPLTDEQARELKRGIKGANGKLYRQGTEVIDPETGWAVDGESIGTWHNDITVQYPNGKYLRWAAVPPKNPDGPGIKPGMGKFGVFPGYVQKDGETKSVQTTWILQPEHFRPTNPEVIEEGYGKGVCKVVSEGRAEVWLGREHQKDGKSIRYLHISPEGIDGSYAIIHDEGDKHLVVRLAPRPIPRGAKLRMKEVRPGTPEAEALFQDPNYLAQAKKDGASAWIKVEVNNSGDKPTTQVSIGSWRESKRFRNEYGIEEPIDYTDKLPHIRDEISKIPAGEVDFEGRVEVWAGGRDGDRNLQQKLQWDDIKAGKHPAKPYIYVTDVTVWKGEDVTHLPYEERLKYVEELNKKSRAFKVPPTASTEKGKRNLWDAGREEEWVDGVVFKHRTDPDAPNIKLKYRWEEPRKAIVLGVNEGDGKYKGTTGSLRCRDTELGVEFSVSGEGLTDDVREAIWAQRHTLEGTEVDYYSCPDRARVHGEIFQPTLAGYEG